MDMTPEEIKSKIKDWYKKHKHPITWTLRNQTGFSLDEVVELFVGLREYGEKQSPLDVGPRGDKITRIYKFQLEAIAEALRVVANTYACHGLETCMDRMVSQAEQFAKNALAGDMDKEARYGQKPIKSPDVSESPGSQEAVEFAEWIGGTHNPYIMHDGRWIQSCGNSTSWSTEELYNLFRQTK